MNKQTLYIASALIVFAILSRFVPHPVNVTPVGALGLFAGAFLVDRRYWLVPLFALLISDAVIGFYDLTSMFFVYLGFACAALIGRFALANKQGAVRIGVTAFASANVFFVLSNFGTWLSGLLYPVTMEGLVACYVAAIPFYGNTVLGDLFYSYLLFGLYALLYERVSRNHSPA